MSELRKDPIVGRWIIIAPERLNKIDEIEEKEIEQSQVSFCPFCEGHELNTPKEIFAFRYGGSRPNTPGWHTRVVPNKFPVLKIEGDIGRTGIGMYDMMNGLGAHEVIIETPEHNKKIFDFDIQQIKYILSSYKYRLDDLKKDVRFKYILIFKNDGERTGTVIQHSHSQLIATPIVPIRVKEELEGAKGYYEYKERCIYCDIIKEELNCYQRIIIENTHFVSFAPFASRFPFETWIIPKRHNAYFNYIEDNEITSLAEILKETLKRINIALHNPAYNYILHIAPVNIYMKKGPTLEEDFHWHIEIMPRIKRVAGFEWGSGFYINSTSPEDAASILKAVEIK
ncbi:MAG: galactose-1-phosphate uridylyltransferase [Candidatus Firestonebacteria bacterium]|nr:galactose-1-phosphate uridylyltransferase [Candidatus Firestonebacteria bacterium]